MIEQDFVKMLAASGATGLMCSWFLQGLKKSNLPFLKLISTDAASARFNLAASAILAGLGAIGVHTDFGLSPDGFHLAMHGTWTDLAHGVSQWMWQLANNHAAYKLFVVPPEIQGESRAILRQILPLLDKIAANREKKEE